MLSKPKQLEHKELCKEAKVSTSAQPPLSTVSTTNWGPLADVPVLQ